MRIAPLLIQVGRLAMASPATSMALTKRPSDELMAPPPPPKRIKRPPKVLDEDEYTRALSQIIARDFFPGLVETKSQKEYLDALDSNDPVWIAAAGKKLEQAMTPRPNGSRKAAATRLSTPSFRSSLEDNRTPQGWQGASTPAASVATEPNETDPLLEFRHNPSSNIDTTTLSLSGFQAKYTSEDNESFNALLDKQNLKRREKNAFLWNDNKIPSPRQIAQRDREAKLLKASSSSSADSGNHASTNTNALALTTGATSSRPARPDGWKSQKGPNNSLMFQPTGVEDELVTVAERAQAESRAPPKQTLYHNTRLHPPPPSGGQSQGAPHPPPPSPSLSALRSAIAGHPRGPPSSLAPSDVDADGSETPRVNGYAFVDDEEEQPEPPPPPEATGPSYRDLLSGQADASPSPFTIKENRKREDLHHRMVEKTNRRKREARGNANGAGALVKTPTPGTVPRFMSSPFVGGGGGGGVTPGGGGGGGGRGGAGVGGMTPAAQRLLQRVGGNTPKPKVDGDGAGSGSGLKHLWTPTPRRMEKADAK